MSSTQTYILSALLLHSTNQEVTVDLIKKIFQHLNISIDEKIAAKFVLPKYTYENLCQVSQNTSTSSPVSAGKEVIKEEVVEEPSEEVDMDGFF